MVLTRRTVRVVHSLLIALDGFAVDLDGLVELLAGVGLVALGLEVRTNLFPSL